MQMREFESRRFPDHEGLSIIEHRLPIVLSHLERWRLSPDARGISARYPSEEWFGQLEQAVSNPTARDFDVRSRGRYEWLNKHLLPLAHNLDLLRVTESTTLRQLYRTGAFDKLNQETERLQRPDAENILPLVREALEKPQHHNHRHVALMELELCRDDKTAARVVEAWRRCERHAAGLARSVVLGYLKHDDLGLLVGSAYPYTNELLFLEAQRELVNSLCPSAMVQLRADIVALARACKTVFRDVWCMRILQEPPGTEYRRRLARQIGTRRRGAWVQAITGDHYTALEAAALVEHTLCDGLNGLIAYRSNHDNPAISTEGIERFRLQRGLEQHYGALSDEDRASIEALASNLQVAIRTTEVQFPLMALLTERPGSPRRLRVSRRFRFGLAAIAKRRHHKRRRTPKVVRNVATQRAERQPSPASQLIQVFAELCNMDEREATDRLRNLITYGGVGLLPRERWLTCLDPRLLSWLRLIKYGRLEGRVPWPRLMTQLDVYRRALGLPQPISSLLARAVFNAIRRPAFWHGGQGEATARLRQRGTLVVDGAPRLHDKWAVLSIPSPVPLADALGQPVGKHGHLVLVIEVNGLLPLTMWPTASSPTSRDVCLALYQAIWHPGDENWPVKGIPEELLVCNELLVGEREDLERAAAYLLADVHVQPRVKLLTPELRELKRQLTKGIATALRPLALNERTPGQVARSLKQWIQKEFYPYHRSSPVWPEIAQHGVVMPGHDTPAAGWLLPHIGEATIFENSLEYEGRYYRRPLDASLLAAGIHIRHFPAPVLGGEKLRVVNGVFVQLLHDKGTRPVVQYVLEQR